MRGCRIGMGCLALCLAPATAFAGPLPLDAYDIHALAEVEVRFDKKGDAVRVLRWIVRKGAAPGRHPLATCALRHAPKNRFEALADDMRAAFLREFPPTGRGKTATRAAAKTAWLRQKKVLLTPIREARRRGGYRALVPYSRQPGSQKLLPICGASSVLLLEHRVTHSRHRRWRKTTMRHLAKLWAR